MISAKQFGQQLWIAAVVNGQRPAALQIKKAVAAKADLIEFRLDTFTRQALAELPAQLARAKKKCKLPFLITVRRPKEQGNLLGCQKYNEAERLKIYMQFLDCADLLDVELGSARIAKILLQAAHRKKKLVILSYHHFEKTPSNRALNVLIKKFKTMRGDIFKIAAQANNFTDASRLMLFCGSLQKLPRIAIAMGQWGSFSRLLAPAFGSCITYGAIEQSTAPGQLPVKKLASDCKIFYQG